MKKNISLLLCLVIFFQFSICVFADSSTASTPWRNLTDAAVATSDWVNLIGRSFFEVIRTSLGLETSETYLDLVDEMQRQYGTTTFGSDGEPTDGKPLGDFGTGLPQYVKTVPLRYPNGYAVSTNARGSWYYTYVTSVSGFPFTYNSNLSSEALDAIASAYGWSRSYLDSLFIDFYDEEFFGNYNLGWRYGNKYLIFSYSKQTSSSPWYTDRVLYGTSLTSESSIFTSGTGLSFDLTSYELLMLPSICDRTQSIFSHWLLRNKITGEYIYNGTSISSVSNSYVFYNISTFGGGGKTQGIGVGRSDIIGTDETTNEEVIMQAPEIGLQNPDTFEVLPYDIFDPGANKLYAPSGTIDVSGWTYDYSTRTYNFNTVDNSFSGQVVYGDNGCSTIITDNSTGDTVTNVYNYVTITNTGTGGGDNGNSGGSDGGGDSGGGSTPSWWDKLTDKLGTLLGTVLGGIIDIIGSAFVEILDSLIALVDNVFTSLNKVLSFGGSFRDWLGSFFSFLPEELVTLLTLSVSLMITLAVITWLRGR